MRNNDSRHRVQSKTVRTAHLSCIPASCRAGPGGAAVLEAVAGDELDRALIAAIASGDEAAFNEIHARYYGRVANFVRRITRHSELTAEITNDTLWTIWRCAASFRGSSKVSTWIIGIAYRIGRTALQRSHRRLALEEPLRDQFEMEHEPWPGRDDREWVGAGLVELSAEQRTVLDLFYHFGHSCKEIAAIVDCPAGTVKTRMHHGRRKLRESLPRLAGFEPG